MERARTNHERLWAAIDGIAARHGLSPSGLARRAGLDATALNKSKRFTADGRPRWPSTESIDKILAATGCGLLDLVRLVDARAARATAASPRAAPRLTGFHDDGADAEVARRTRRLEIADEAMAPVFRRGDVLILAVEETPRPGDRVVLSIDGGCVVARVYLGRGAEGLRFEPIVGGPDETIAEARIAGLARILWASQ
ncbi:MAG: helix-turn-helix transcriptional regulator [Hyphomicrobiales bacterium]|nr:helix-turn-helix transcriptional regulator [Hyphomicrobiales bacterium]